MKRVLILGGGFAGVQAAIELQKNNNFEVILISERDYLYLYPISIWVPTREKSFEDVKVPLSKIQDAFGFKLLIGKVKKIKAAENKIVCSERTLEYDYLVIAIGTEKMQHMGQENTHSICGKPESSLAIRDALDSLIEKGSGKIAIGFGGNPKDKSAVRGGPAFELMFNIHNLLKKKKIRDKFELTFFAPMESPGERMGSKSLKMIDSMFRTYNIEKRFGKKIKSFEPSGVVFEDDSILSSDLTIFIPASAGHTVLMNSDIPLTEAGFVKIDETCLVTGTENVYAAGDIAAIEGPEWKAKQGHIAELMGKQAAYNIIMREDGSSKRKSYKEHINILCIMDTGNGAAFVFRNGKRAFSIPMPWLGHLVKRGWGHYAQLTKGVLFQDFRDYNIMDCTNCQPKTCRVSESCGIEKFDSTEIIKDYQEPENQIILQAAEFLVDNGKAGSLSRLQETILFIKRMDYKKVGLAYCYGMEKDAKLMKEIFKAEGIRLRTVSCTVGGINQDKINANSCTEKVSCNPLGQARELNDEEADFVIIMGICLGHDILLQRNLKSDFTTLVVKDRVFANAPLQAIR